MITCGCTGDGYQDRQWGYSMQHHTSLLSPYFKTVSDASRSGDFKMLVTYGQYIADDTQKAIDENNQFKSLRNYKKLKRNGVLLCRTIILLGS